MITHSSALRLSTLLLLTACGNKGDSAVSSDTPLGGATSGATDGGSFRIEYTTDPSPIPLSEPFTMRTRVTDNEGRWIEAASVTVNAEMPAHGHGMDTVPSTSYDAEGWYETEGMLFHMLGEWQIVIDVFDGEVIETARMTYGCCYTE